MQIRSVGIDLGKTSFHLVALGGISEAYLPHWFRETSFLPDPRHLGARIGVPVVLHTWSQNLGQHPHLHCLVPAGGLAHDRSC